MLDSGSSRAFITHQVAEELKFERINPVRLTIRTFADPLVISTCTYEGQVYNFINKNYENLVFHGADRIGLPKGPDNSILLAINSVLAPHNL